MNKKIYIILIALFLLTPLFAQESKTYWTEVFEEYDNLIEYRFYKTQEQFDNNVFEYMLENTPYSKSELLKNYKLFCKTLQKSNYLYYKVNERMIDNDYLYCVTAHSIDKVVSCVIWKKVGDTFYSGGWYEEF